LRCARPRQEESLPAQAAAWLASAELPAEQLLEARAEELALPREAAPALRALAAYVETL